MIVLAALLAVAACSSHTSGCDLPNLCIKVDQTIAKSDENYKGVQTVETKVDSLDVKLDSIILGQRLHATLEGIERSKFVISKIYKEHIYLSTKTEADFDIDAANDDCKNQGGYLLELEDNAERDFTLDFAQTVGGTTNFAMGGTDKDSEGSWVYINSKKPVPSSSILTWLQGEPNNLGGNEDCMVFRMDLRGLNDVRCNLKVKYICEVPLLKV